LDNYLNCGTKVKAKLKSRVVNFNENFILK